MDWNVMLREFLLVTSLVLLSCVVPIGIFVGRNNIRASRREIVRDLEQLFSFATLANGTKVILPSFELVKYKYDPKDDQKPNKQDNPYGFRYYSLPVLIYVTLTALCFRMAFSPQRHIPLRPGLQDAVASGPRSW